mmetsp:Transcript_17182/g.37589  ORF Transcript_17182/g.37589 Transcript_17182/m.37589 type:complete len:91 (+) Transcript_17182:721-993(+)
MPRWKWAWAEDFARVYIVADLKAVFKGIYEFSSFIASRLAKHNSSANTIFAPIVLTRSIFEEYNIIMYWGRIFTVFIKLLVLKLSGIYPR